MAVRDCTRRTGITGESHPRPSRTGVGRGVKGPSAQGEAAAGRNATEAARTSATGLQSIVLGVGVSMKRGNHHIDE